ncbi:hypothetical protein VE03_07366 [Pseudogymnoascus sp. 23342-1-I1]|nr:hypothetical protein VE03_07366 [Pseudogymnoascus sp. 23342-1-I1]
MSLPAPPSVRRSNEAPALSQDAIQLARPSTAPPAPQGSTKSLLEVESDIPTTDAPTNVSTTSDQTHVLTALDDPTDQEIANNPWKYAGYPQFSRWVASDQAWFITRRFSTLNARIILLLQDKIVELEEKLNMYDEFSSQSDEVMQDSNDTHNGSFRLDRESQRTRVLDDLVVAVAKYNSFVNEYSQLASRPPVRNDDVKAVRKWLANHKDAIDDLEAAYINEEHDDDLIPVHPKPRSWFRTVLEKTPILRKRPLRHLLSRDPCDPLIKKKDKGKTVWHNDKRVERLSAVVIGIVGLGMLIGPIWALYKVEPSNKRLGIISGFIVIFYILVGIATTAKLFESLAAVAAYSAVLMVFMQIQSS